MTKPGSTLLVTVLDRSGSMNHIKDEVIGGFDSFVEAQKKEPGECKMTLWQFDNEYDEVWSLRDVATLPSIGTFYAPRGMTALNDAVGRTIVSVGIELAKRPEHERPQNVIFIIVTDGQENSSKEYKGAPGKAKIKEMIQHQTEKYGWKFTYIGANVDAFAEAQGYGIPTTAAMNYAPTKKGMVGAYHVMAASVLRSRQSGEALSYSPAEREEAMATDDAE